MLERDDFYSADVKKLARDGYYRAKLDDANRLLLRFARYRDERYALLLEVIEQHAYDRSRFLRGAQVDESKLQPLQPAGPPEADAPALAYVNPAEPSFQPAGQGAQLRRGPGGALPAAPAGDHRRLRGQRQDRAHAGEDESGRGRRPVRDALAVPGAPRPRLVLRPRLPDRAPERGVPRLPRAARIDPRAGGARGRLSGFRRLAPAPAQGA